MELESASCDQYILTFVQNEIDNVSVKKHRYSENITLCDSIANGNNCPAETRVALGNFIVMKKTFSLLVHIIYQKTLYVDTCIQFLPHLTLGVRSSNLGHKLYL